VDIASSFGVAPSVEELRPLYRTAASATAARSPHGLIHRLAGLPLVSNGRPDAVTGTRLIAE
jgi:hypothetical protein